MLSFILAVFSLLSLVQVRPSAAAFVFEFALHSVSTSGTCDPGPFRDASCETYLSIFCLRDAQSMSEEDCPLGSSGRTDANDMQVRVFTPPLTREILSQKPWPRQEFQMYVEAIDEDDPGGDDDLDDIFINRRMEVNTNFTEIEAYTGISNRVTIQMSFRVMCQENYYGADCTTFCLAQDDAVNGHYTCNSDGSIQCRDGFENPSNDCRDIINPCDSSPCANNGSCVPMGPFNYTCQCAGGYTGPVCEDDIDDCLTVTCPNNSMCMDSINPYECICNPGFEKEEQEDRCIQTEIPNTETPKTENQGAMTDSANGGEVEKSNTPTIIGIAVAVAVAVVILSIFIVVFLIVVIKWRRGKPYSRHQEGQQLTGADNTQLTVKPEKMVDNLIYVSSQSISSHSPYPQQLDGQLPPSDVIYATPTSPELEATVHVVDNPVYGEGTGSSFTDNDENVRYIQNPVYGDALDGSAQQGEVYSTPQLPHKPPLGTGEKALNYDYAKMDVSPNGKAVIKKTSMSTEVQAAHEYAVVDKSKKRKNQSTKQSSLGPHLATDPSRDPYEQLHHGTEPHDCIRLSEVEGLGYEALQFNLSSTN